MPLPYLTSPPAAIADPAIMEDRMSILTTMLTTTPFFSKQPAGLIAKWLTGRRDRRLLQAMSDGALRDIGLDRGHIDFAILAGRSKAQRT